MNAGLTLTTLGDFVVRQNGEILVIFPSRKAEALLVYLAVQQAGPVRRESLFTLLWPEMPEESARHNLRQVLYAVRQTCPEVSSRDGDKTVPMLLADRQTVQMNPDASVEVDIHTLDRLLRESDSHEHASLASCETCIQALDQAAELYAGEFLSDFYLEDSNQFEDWAAANREAYRSKALATLETLTEVFKHKGAYDQACAYADRQLKIDPLRESAYRQMMELLSMSGQRAEALRIYQQCARVLEIELGTNPSRETTALYDIIRREDIQRSDILPQGGSIRGYELREQLGSGHAGVVYRARQPVIGRDVAIKVILPQFANHPDFIRRFEVEAQLVARLEHPYIVPLYDYWRDPSGAYLVMRWLKGGNLQTDLARGPWKPAPAVQLVDQVAAALALAHRQGVVHCDIKPANILLDEMSNAYLTDFGIAALTGPLTQWSQYPSWAGEPSSTGSLGYASPESTRGQAPTPLADIYSLGVVLFELLTGVHPFPGSRGEALVQKHLTQPLPSVLALRPELPAGVDKVIQTATQKDPAQRYSDVETLAGEFRLALIPEGGAAPILPGVKYAVRNPYKGLRPFAEADAVDFFGRDDLVARLLEKLSSDNESDPSRFLAVVGPSGSGKSSVVKAGLIPAIRKGLIPGSERWFVVEMAPGSHPLEELETALLRIAIQTPEDMQAQFRADRRGLVRILRRALPEKGSEVLLVIDQFEELFTLVESEADRNHFLDMLATAVSDLYSPLQLVITLRADFYDRPLRHGDFAELVRAATEVVLPLHPEELERAICGPAERVGVSLEPALVARIVQEVGDQPGALPLLQYALTECFERREADKLTLAAYEASGGVLGALGRRAEEIFTNLSPSEKEVTRQLFLRLITLGEGIEDTRRRVLRSELEAVTGMNGDGALGKEGNDPASSLASVIDRFGRYRLLTFDHDPTTRAPTVEVAHEALLREWPRLRGWLDESRDDIRMQRLLGAATQEWLAAGSDAGFLLRGARLDQFSLWEEDTNVALTQDELTYLATSQEKRRERRTAEAERQAHEASLEQRARRFLGILVGVFAVAAVIAVILSGVAFSQGNIARQNAATAVSAQGEALVLADSRATQQAIAEAEAAARATQQALAVEEAEQRAAAESVAQDNLRLARANELGTVSINLMEKQPDLAFLLSVEAYRQSGTMHNWTALYTVGTNNPQIRRVMHAHLGGVEGLDYSPDGKLLASGGTDGSIRLWDMDPISHGFGTSIQLPPDQKLPPVESVAFSPDGRLLAASTADGESLVGSKPEINHVLLWDMDPASSTYRQLLIDRIAEELILGRSAVAFNPTEPILAVAQTGRIELWDVDRESPTFGQVIGTLGMSSYFNSVAFSPDGKKLAAGTCTFEPGNIFLWQLNFQELNLSQEVAIHNPDPLCGVTLAFSPDADRLIVGGDWDGNLLVWDVMPDSPTFGELNATLSGHDWLILKTLFSPDGKRSASVGGADYSARLWDMDSESPSFGQQIGSPLRHNSLVLNAAFSPDGDTLVVGTENGGIYLWNMAQEALPVPSLPAEWDDAWVLIDADLAETQVPHPLETLLLGHTGVIESVVFSPDGKLLASAGSGTLSSGRGELDGTIRLWDADPDSPGFGQQVGEPLRGHTAWVTGLAYDPNGARLASSSGDRTVRLWDVDPSSATFGQTIGNPLEGHKVDVHEIAFSPDGHLLASTDIEKSVYLWDVDPGSPTYSQALISGSDWNARGNDGLAFSPDGRFLACGSSGIPHSYTNLYEPIQLWDVDQNSPAFGQQVVELTGGHWLPISRLKFSPGGKILASASGDSTILWDVDPDSPAFGQVIGIPLDAEGSGVIGLSFSPDGSFLASATIARGKLQLWDVDPDSPSFGQSLGVPLNQENVLAVTIEYSPDGKFLAVGDINHRVHLWNVDPAAWIEYICGRAGRNLTEKEWDLYLSWAGPYDPEYKTCPQWP